MDLILYTFKLLTVGVGVGLLSGALGLGGGILMVPAFMTFVAGMDAHTAKGTSLFIIIFVALINAWRQHGEVKQAPWKLVAVLTATSIVGGYAGAFVTNLLGEQIVLIIFMLLLALLAVRTFLLRPLVVEETEVQYRPGIALAIGFVTGLVAGATGTGGGAVLVPLALMAGIASNARVVLLSNMVMVGTSIAGTVAHLQATPVFDQRGTIGLVYLPLVPLVLIGSQLGSPLGRWCNRHMSLHHRRVVMGLLLGIIALRILLRVIAP